MDRYDDYIPKEESSRNKFYSGSIDIEIEEAYERKGIAQKLFDEAIKEVKRKGTKYLYLIITANDENYKAAKHIYLKNGFKPMPYTDSKFAFMMKKL